MIRGDLWSLRGGGETEEINRKKKKKKSGRIPGRFFFFFFLKANIQSSDLNCCAIAGAFDSSSSYSALRIVSMIFDEAKARGEPRKLLDTFFRDVYLIYQVHDVGKQAQIVI